MISRAFGLNVTSRQGAVISFVFAPVWHDGPLQLGASQIGLLNDRTVQFCFTQVAVPQGGQRKVGMPGIGKGQVRVADQRRGKIGVGQMRKCEVGAG